MKYETLKGDDEHPFIIDMISWPNCNGPLYHLERSAGIKVLKKSSWFLSGDFFADFEFNGHVFHIDTPVSTPWLSATKGCSESLFNELLIHVNKYSTLNPVQGFIGFFKYFRLPAPANKKRISSESSETSARN